MNPRCQDYRGSLVPHLRGELTPLEDQRTAAHLRNCDDCSLVLDDLNLGFLQAKGWLPSVTDAHMGRLNGRLMPFVQAARSRQRRRNTVASLSTVSAMAASVALWFAWPGEGLPLSEAVTPVTPVTSVTMVQWGQPIVMEEAVEVVHAAPSAFLRVISSGVWDGRVEGSARNSEIRMTRGFGVFAFRGGKGRTLVIEAPGGRIEVVGTRFFVEHDMGRTSVGVGEGKVRVRTQREQIYLRTGEIVSFDVSGHRIAGVEPRAAAYLDDPYLLQLENKAGRRAARKRRARRRAWGPVLDFGTQTAEVIAIEAVEDGTALLDALETAESLASGGEMAAAAQKYRAIARDPRPSFALYKPLARYERARLLGLHLGEVARARQILQRLVAGQPGEVQRQAVLALCELDLEDQPCAAAQCLQQLLREHGADFEVTTEADRLFRHWGLSGIECGQE